jgi:phosphatidylglycerol:prolipoprotein diacylglycerol transferase
MLDWYQKLPLHIDPVAFSIGSFNVRWYSLSYLVGFLAVYFLLAWRIKKGEYKKKFPISNSQFPNVLLDYFIVIILATLIGGRIGYVIFYNFNSFITHPLSIISPYDASGQFVGIFGMSFHGALIGALLGSYFFCAFKKISFWAWSDFVVPAVPLGYFFGRVGNFLNGELFGRVTSSPLGIYFLTDPNTQRYPSQLLEALLEGLLLFAILWPLRNSRKLEGNFLFIYIIGYSIARIISEFFRQPDPQIGFILVIFTMGQILSVVAIIICTVWVVLKKQKT